MDALSYGESRKKLAPIHHFVPRQDPQQARSIWGWRASSQVPRGRGTCRASWPQEINDCKLLAPQAPGALWQSLRPALPPVASGLAPALWPVLLVGIPTAPFSSRGTGSVHVLDGPSRGRAPRTSQARAMCTQRALWELVECILWGNGVAAD